MAEKVTRREFIKASALSAAIGGITLSSLDLNTLRLIAARAGYARVHKIGGELVIKLSEEKNKELEKIGGSVLLDDENILIRISETQFAAVNLICKHKGCTVEYEGTKFVCPCHGSEYERDGKLLSGPSKQSLDTHETVYNAEAGTVTVKMKTAE